MISTMESTMFREAVLAAGRLASCLYLPYSVDNLQKELGEGQLFLLALLLMGD